MEKQLGACQLRGWSWYEENHAQEIYRWHWVYDHSGLSPAEREGNTARWGQPGLRQPEFCQQVVREQLGQLRQPLQTPHADYPALLARFERL